jgi:hypothetical protein
MSSRSQNELASFHQFISQLLGSNQAELSPEEALGLWREQNPSPDDLEAVRQSLQDFERGDRGITVEEFDREFRRRHNI